MKPPDLRLSLDAIMSGDDLLSRISQICCAVGGLLGLTYGIAMAVTEGFGVLGWIVAPLLFCGLGGLLGIVLPALLVGAFWVALGLLIIGAAVWILVKLVQFIL